jgi:large subunit ribosomal protein L12
MEYIYAALLLHQLGQEVNETNLTKVVRAAGAEVDEIKVKALLSALKNVNIDEVIKNAAAAPAAVAMTPTTTGAPAAEAKKAEEEKKEEKREEALEGLAALFG